MAAAVEEVVVVVELKLLPFHMMEAIETDVI